MDDSTAPAKTSFRERFAYLKAFAEWIQNRPVGVAGTRYVKQNGNVLAGGIAYYSLWSVAAAVVLLVTIASFAIFNNQEFSDAVIDYVSEAIPGLFPTDDSPGLVNPESVKATPVSGVVGVVAFLVLVWTATRYLRGLRTGVRTMLGAAAAKKIPGTVRDIIVLFALGLLAILGTVVQVLALNFTTFITNLLGGGDLIQLLVPVVGFLAATLMNCGFVALALLVLGRAQARAAVLVSTILIAGFAFSVLQSASQLLINAASNNAILAPFASVIVLMLFVDLTARAILIAAAWIGAVADHEARIAAGEVLPERPTVASVVAGPEQTPHEGEATNKGDS